MAIQAIYLASEKVHVYPCANRGANYDLESKVNTEYNLIHMPSVLGTANDYTVSFNEATHKLTLVVHGYYFDLDLTDSGIDKSKHVWCGIKLKKVYLMPNESNATLSKFPTEILCNFNNPEYSLDYNDNGYTFQGLKFIYDTNPISEEAVEATFSSSSDNPVYKLQIFDGSNNLCNNAPFKIAATIDNTSGWSATPTCTTGVVDNAIQLNFQGIQGVGISSISNNNSDPYANDNLTRIRTVTYDDGDTASLNIKDGNGIVSIAKDDSLTNGLVDTYVITYKEKIEDPNHPGQWIPATDKFTVTNGKGLSITGTVKKYGTGDSHLPDPISCQQGDAYIVEDANDAPSGVIPSGQPKQGVLFVLAINSGTKVWVYAGQVKVSTIATTADAGLVKAHAYGNISGTQNYYVNVDSTSGVMTVRVPWTDSGSTAVSYESQSLTTEQKTQARTNIGAGTGNSNLTLAGTGSATTAAKSDHTHDYSNTYQAKFTDGSATIASVANDIVTLKAGITQSGGAISNSSGSNITLHKVAKTGAYGDLSGTPTLATVATSGSYTDLTNKPDEVSGANDSTNWTSLTIGNDTYGIPAAVSGNNDGTNWTTITIGNVTKNIPSGGGGGGGVSDYSQLTGKPKINNVELSSGNNTWSTLGLDTAVSGLGYTKNAGTITSVTTTAGAHTAINTTSGAVAFNVPTNTSHLTNDSNFIVDNSYRHITVSSTSVSDGTTTFNKYTHPTYTAQTAAAKKVGLDSTGHVVLGDSLTASDVGALAAETDTLATVTGRGATTSTDVTFSGDATFDGFANNKYIKINSAIGIYQTSTSTPSYVYGNAGQVLMSGGGANSRVYWGDLPIADTSADGVIRVSNVNSSPVTTVANITTDNIYYGIERDKNHKLYVSLPVPADDILEGTADSNGITKYAPYSATTATTTWIQTGGNAGKLYLGDNNPRLGTRLNYNGHFYATKVFVGSTNPIELTGNTGTVTSIAAGTGLTTDQTSGAAITGSGTLSLASSGVTADSYGPSATPSGSTFNVPYITVDTYGRITSASNTSVTVAASDNDKVKQSLFSGNASYPLLLRFNNTSNTDTDITNSVKCTLSITGNPSTGMVTAASFNATSDIRKKENIVDYTPEKSILDLPIKKFDIIDGLKNQIGCIAQDLKEICPEIVQEDSEGYLSIQESKLVYLLLDEVKKLRKEVNELKGE